jgi:hypothetical protein
MSSLKKKEAIWTWAVALVIGHIVAYCNNYLSIDQVVTCSLAYPAIAVLTISMFED